MSNDAPKCQHIKTSGTQCGSPAVKDNQFCFYHQHCTNVTFTYYANCRDYSASEIRLPAFEDAQSIQLALREVTELLLRRKLEPQVAGLVLYALQIASANLKRLELELGPQKQLPSNEVPTSAKIAPHSDTPPNSVTPKEAAPIAGIPPSKIDTILGCACETETDAYANADAIANGAFASAIDAAEPPHSRSPRARPFSSALSASRR